MDKKKRSDAFWNIFLFTENGKPKSTLLIYSFCFCIFAIAVYVLCFLLIMEPLDNVFNGMENKWPVWVISLIESAVPSVAGTLFICIFFFVFKEKRIVPISYLWLSVLAVFISIYVLVTTADEARDIMLALVEWYFIPPVILGIIASFSLYFRHKKKHPPMPEIESWRHV